MDDRNDIPTVYAVDDDQAVLRALRRLMESVGLQVETYKSAEAFLDHWDSSRPGCLVLDVRMPGQGGLELQRRLSSMEFPAVPIIFITGHGDVPMCARAMKAGAVDFLQKPFNEQALLDAIHRALEQDRHARQAYLEWSTYRRRVGRLTPRESQVFKLVVLGITNREIADKIGASEKTVKVHRSRVMQKMEADSLAELVRLASLESQAPPSASPTSSNDRFSPARRSLAHTDRIETSD